MSVDYLCHICVVLYVIILEVLELFLIIYLPTIVPIPRSLLVTNVPMMFVKNSGALVPENIVNWKGYGMNQTYFSNHKQII